MENYEKKYKAALNWMRSIYPTMQGTDREDAEHHFPELKESEDEKIRKGLIRGLSAMKNIHNRQTFSDDAINIDDAIAWLEKQGEQKSIDKVESEFKVGDWITNGEYLWQITNIDRLDCTLKSQNGDVVEDNINYVENEFHIWTIKDAKDGDVLVFDDIIMIFKNVKTVCTANTYILYCNGIVVDDWCDFGHNAHPATKEQRDLLFQKMKEAGYEWDAKKKELKKIEQKPSITVHKFRVGDNVKAVNEEPLIITKIDDKGYWSGELFICDFDEEACWDLVEQDSAWGEKDEKMKSLIISTLTSMGTLNLERYHNMNLDEVKNWLKSLKLNRWKPSEEQMRVLQIAIRDYGICHEKHVLESLYNNLKNL